ncbi:hypothetical protein MBLNU13_g02234t1 [Cladosporium sp. NU13]
MALHPGRASFVIESLPGSNATITQTLSSSISARATPTGQFLIQLDNTNLCLTGEEGHVPEGDTDQRLVTTSDEANAIAFSAATDGNGQVTLVTVDGTTLFSDQDAFLGSGDGPIYWDNLANRLSTEDTSDNANVFCLQSDNTFVVQNLGTQDPNDDANIVQICPGDGAVYLHTAAAAAIHGSTTIRLQIANERPAIITNTSSTSSAAPTSRLYKEGRFRVRMAPPRTEGYMTNFDSGVGKAVPESSEANFAPISDESLAVIFETVPGQSGLVVLYNLNGDALYLNQDRNAGGPVYANTQAAITDNEYISISLFVRQDDTIIFQNLGQDAADPADDSITILLCPASRGLIYQIFAANNPTIPSDCVAQTLIGVAIVPEASSTSIPTPVSSPSPPPYVPPVGCPSTGVQIPDNQAYWLKSSRFTSLWLTSISGSRPGKTNMITTNDISAATSFTTTSGNTGQVSLLSGANDNTLRDSPFFPYYNNNLGVLYFVANAARTWGTTQLCLQPDNTFTVYSEGADGPTADDPNLAVVCPPNINIPSYEYLMNGDTSVRSNRDNVAYFMSEGCKAHVLVYDPIV